MDGGLSRACCEPLGVGCWGLQSTVSWPVVLDSKPCCLDFLGRACAFVPWELERVALGSSMLWLPCERIRGPRGGTGNLLSWTELVLLCGALEGCWLFGYNHAPMFEPLLRTAAVMHLVGERSFVVKGIITPHKILAGACLFGASP